MRVEAGDVRSVVLESEEFKVYRDRVRRVLGDWRQEHAPRLRGLEVGDLPKALIRDLAEDLLRRFAGLPLLDRYDVYQCLMDYWDEVMQDDVYLVVTEGWAEAARPRVLVPVRGKGTAEPPDLTVKRKKYKMDLLPPGLVVARHFATRAGQKLTACGLRKRQLLGNWKSSSKSIPGKTDCLRARRPMQGRSRRPRSGRD